MVHLVNRIEKLFRQRFHVKPLLLRSPGRVNLIGEHTDYNEGFVLPAAIDKAIYFAIALRQDDRCHFVAADLKQDFECNLHTLQKSALGWPNYLLGVIDQFQRAGYTLRGFDCVFGGDIPIGAGLSSSAAIEAGLAFALNDLFWFGLDKLTLVKLSQKAENEFVGVKCGIMDQFINIHGLEKKVVKLDCRSLEFEYYPFSRDDLRIVLCDTQVRRALAGSEYNVRRQQCETGVQHLQTYNDNIKSLRDVSLPLLQQHRQELAPLIYRRCDYVVRENLRVEQACADLQQNDLKAFGQRLFASHAGLRDDYEVSCAELDVLVATAAQIEGVYGARMMGAGFGGCTINLVEETALEYFGEVMSSVYQQKMNKSLKTYVCKLSAGTEWLTD